MKEEFDAQIDKWFLNYQVTDRADTFFHMTLGNWLGWEAGEWYN